MPRPRIGVLLSGCGVYDGSEIHEAVLTLAAIDRAGAEAVCIAPDVPQHHVVDHRTGEPVPAERRNVRAESARIARGKVQEVSTVKVRDLDALVIPGGFGAAKNLSDFAFAGAACRVDPHVERLVREVHVAGKWIGAMCIAPVILARVLGSEKPRLTIGTDPQTAAAVETMGAHHVACAADGVVADDERRVITTPAYMLAGTIGQAAAGIDALVRELLVRVRTGVPVMI